MFTRRRITPGRRLVAIMTDTHAGKDVGLLNPDTVLIKIDDQGCERLWKPEQTTTQRWLWSVFIEARDWLVDLAGDDEIVVIHNGDVTHGGKHGNVIDGTNIPHQRTIAVDNLRVYADLPNVQKVRLMTGTLVHVPENAEARVASKLREKTGKDVGCVHHARFDMGKDVIEIAHHGPFPGSRLHLEGNIPRIHLRDRVLKDRKRGVVPARAYVYGHYHVLVYANTREMWGGVVSEHDLVIVPAFSGLDDYIRKITRSEAYIQAGIVVLEFVNGEMIGKHEYVRELDMRKEEKL